MSFEVTVEGQEAPFITLSDEWIVIQAEKRGVSEEIILKALETYHDAVLECTGENCDAGNFPRLEDYLPTKRVSSWVKVSTQERAAKDAERERKAWEEVERKRAVHEALRKKLGFEPLQ